MQGVGLDTGYTDTNDPKGHSGIPNSSSTSQTCKQLKTVSCLLILLSLMLNNHSYFIFFHKIFPNAFRLLSLAFLELFLSYQNRIFRTGLSVVKLNIITISFSLDTT